jgi:hypothetical protein
MKVLACLLVSAAFATPAFAEPLKFKPLLDARLRFELVDQEPIVEEANALTLRARVGGELSNKVWSFLVEGEGTLAIVEDYNSGVNGKTLFPIVADPENIELNRAQVQFRGIPKTVVTVGRQRINLDDQRFVGAAGWRQNEQTFDAVRVENTSIANLKVDLTYAWSDRTIYGIDGFGTNQQSIYGDNVFANIGYKTKYGTLTGFAYLVDQDEAAVFAFRRSSQTYGGRFAGGYPLSKSVKLNYTASYAHQTDYHHNPNDYSADYFLGELGVAVKGFTATGGYELLGADGGTALTSFQTPLATLHKFQGWADKFLTTPPNGVQDAYGSLGYTFTKVGPFASIAGLVAYHDFRSDILDQHYGDEWNLQLSAKIDKFTLLLKYADYDAKPFAGNPTADTRKFWASVEFAY